MWRIRTKLSNLQRRIKSFSKLPVSKEDRTIRRYVRKRMKRKPYVPEESEQDIAIEELERAIDKSKNNKASGEDEIPYEFLKNIAMTHLKCERNIGVKLQNFQVSTSYYYKLIYSYLV